MLVLSLVVPVFYKRLFTYIGYVSFKACYVIFFIKDHFLRLCSGKACSVIFLQEISSLGYVRFKSCGVIFL